MSEDEDAEARRKALAKDIVVEIQSPESRKALAKDIADELVSRGLTVRSGKKKPHESEEETDEDDDFEKDLDTEA